PSRIYRPFLAGTYVGVVTRNRSSSIVTQHEFGGLQVWAGLQTGPGGPAQTWTSAPPRHAWGRTPDLRRAPRPACPAARSSTYSTTPNHLRSYQVFYAPADKTSQRGAS